MSQSLKISSGDVVINGANGRPSTIRDSIKLRQDLTEFFTVNIQPNGFGAGLEQLIGVVEVNTDVFLSLADRQIREGFEAFRGLQNDDSRISREIDERLVAITYLAVEKNPSDPTQYWFRVNVVTEKGVELPLVIPQSI